MMLRWVMVNSLWPVHAASTIPSQLTQVMACRLFGTKSLSGLSGQYLPTYCRLNHEEKNLKFESNLNQSSKKTHLNMPSANSRLFCSNFFEL